MFFSLSSSLLFSAQALVSYSLVHNLKSALTAGTDGPLGKRMENSKTRAEIGWEPKYPSFTEFLGLSE